MRGRPVGRYWFNLWRSGVAVSGMFGSVIARSKVLDRALDQRCPLTLACGLIALFDDVVLLLLRPGGLPLGRYL